MLVARCREGDSGAWEALVDRFSRYVYAITLRAFSLSSHDAEDVFQEVFARTYEQLDKLKDDEAIQPWIAQTTRRLAIDKLRAAQREHPAEPDTDRGGPDESLARIDEALDVHRALDALPDHCQEILDRFFAQDQSYRAIGEELDLPAGTIASRISRCLGKLREQLEGRSTPAGTSGETR